MGNCDNPEVNCDGCEFQSPLFCHLSEQELDLVRRNRLSVLFRKGETIRKQGTYMSHVISLTTGLAKVYIEGFNGKNSIISIVKSSSFIGGPGIYLDKVHHYTVTALTDAKVCFIDLEVFKNLIDLNKAFAHELMKDFSRSILSVYNRLVNLTQKQMPGRMADTLLYLFEEVFESNKLDATLSRQDLSELSGMAKDSAIKVLRNFQTVGIIRFNDHEIELLDSPALHRISRTG
jgi:CRP/FNR family transcriptional regulator, polysaccharide utilization system transcription regulator